MTLATENRRLLVNLSIGQDAHRALRELAAERDQPMSRIVEQLILKEVGVRGKRQ
ncbi:MAG: ribbon-helix-helix protein, CopG family [Candidatus Bipolaricaulis anaerobius]|jgi:hypothetical protein